MSVRFSLLLIAAGAALALLVDYEAQGVSIQMLGIVFAAGGLGGILLSIVARALRGRSKSSYPDEATLRASEDRREAVIRDRS
jgi:hypothetical protein